MLEWGPGTVQGQVAHSFAAGLESNYKSGFSIGLDGGVRISSTVAFILSPIGR